MKRILLTVVLCPLICVLFLNGCSFHNKPLLTVAPREVVSEAPSFDKNQRNSGIISCDDNGCTVTAHFLDRHGIKHGILFKDEGVSPLPDGNYQITGQLMQQCVEQDRVRKNKQQ